MGIGAARVLTRLARKRTYVAPPELFLMRDGLYYKYGAPNGACQERTITPTAEFGPVPLSRLSNVSRFQLPSALSAKSAVKKSCASAPLPVYFPHSVVKIRLW